MRAYLSATLPALFLSTVAPVSETIADRQLAVSSTSRGEALLLMGPNQVGFRAATVDDPSSARLVHVMIWYPTADAVADKPVAVYQLVVPSGPSLRTLPFTITAHDFSSFVDGRLAYGDVLVAPGRHPVVVHLPGAGAPGFVHIYEGIKFASHGFIFVSATQPTGTACQMDEDARGLLDGLLAWDAASNGPFHQAIDRDQVFGGGHSLGGRTWIARTSGQQECGLPTEGRLHGLVLKDATPNTLLVEQLQMNVTPAFLNSQANSDRQTDLQRNLGSRPTMLALEGITPAPSAQNHRLFTQACMAFRANEIAGNPAESFFPPPVVAECRDAVFPIVETYFAQQTTKYNIALLRTLMGDRSFEAVLAPGLTSASGVEVLPWRAPGSGANQ